MKEMIGEDTFARLDDEGEIVLTTEDNGHLEHIIWLDGPTQSKLMSFIARCSSLKCRKSALALDATIRRNENNLINPRNERIGLISFEDTFFVVKKIDYDGFVDNCAEVLLQGFDEYGEASCAAEEEAMSAKLPLDETYPVEVFKVSPIKIKQDEREYTK